jgi:hypothetical protein
VDVTPGGTCEGMEPSSIPAAHSQVLWCPAWRLFLCTDCRSRRNDAELQVPSGTVPAPVPRSLPRTGPEILL